MAPLDKVPPLDEGG